MSKRREPGLLDHEYDGIREHDNPTPGWWHMLFLGSVAFSIIYVMFWHFSELASTPHTRLARAEQAYFKQLFAELGELKPDEKTMVGLMQDAKWMAFGGALFAANCAQCHGAQGGGINGANLTDDSFINVKSLTDLFRVVNEGVSAKGMPAWNTRFSQNEQILVAAYVATLRGTNKPGRGAEGSPIPPWPTAQVPSN